MSVEEVLLCKEQSGAAYCDRVTVGQDGLAVDDGAVDEDAIFTAHVGDGVSPVGFVEADSHMLS